MSQTSEMPTGTQEKPKHKRRSRRSLVWQIAECHFLIDKELASAVDRPSRLTLLKAKLESLMKLLEREDRAKELAKVASARPETTSPTTSRSPVEDCVGDIKGVLAAYRGQKGEGHGSNV
jgi:hypothetical protein